MEYTEIIKAFILVTFLFCGFSPSGGDPFDVSKGKQSSDFNLGFTLQEYGNTGYMGGYALVAHSYGMTDRIEINQMLGFQALTYDRDEVLTAVYVINLTKLLTVDYRMLQCGLLYKCRTGLLPPNGMKLSGYV